tara:strand:- start:621 stop:995 length:375 start_codon:yes stop_codon:yes gene_type:complete
MKKIIILSLLLALVGCNTSSDNKMYFVCILDHDSSNYEYALYIDKDKKLISLEMTPEWNYDWENYGEDETSIYASSAISGGRGMYINFNYVTGILYRYMRLTNEEEEVPPATWTYKCTQKDPLI